MYKAKKIHNTKIYVSTFCQCFDCDNNIAYIIANLLCGICTFILHFRLALTHAAVFSNLTDRYRCIRIVATPRMLHYTIHDIALYIKSSKTLCWICFCHVYL